MATQHAKRVLVVAGLENRTGTGESTARLFAKQGYNIALVARDADSVDKIVAEINSSGGQAAAFAVSSYAHDDITAAWSAIHARFPKPEYTIRAAVFNATHGVRKPFLDITPQDVQDCLQTSVAAAFSFSHGAILAFKENDIEAANGKRGALVFTGATASLRGNVATNVFAAGKFGVRALSQSLAKEFAKENIHVSHVIIDGRIFTDRSEPELKENYDVRLSNESIAASYLYLVNQDRSAWTWELDLRPAHEKW